MIVDESVEDATTLAGSDQVEKSTTDDVIDAATEVSKPKTMSKRAKRLAQKSIEHGIEIDSKLLPQSKYLSLPATFKIYICFWMNVTEQHLFYYRETFPLKIAPWIRVNGSVNRRVLDKYAGSILLYCIENAGLTLFTLCTRFHYLLPIHVYEIVKVCDSIHIVVKLIGRLGSLKVSENSIFNCSTWKNSDAWREQL